MTQDPDNMDRRSNRKGITIQYLSYKEPALKNPEDKILQHREYSRYKRHEKEKDT